MQTQGVLARSPEPEAHDKVLDNNPDQLLPFLISNGLSLIQLPQRFYTSSPDWLLQLLQLQGVHSSRSF